jgi:hypothetical protein
MIGKDVKVGEVYAHSNNPSRDIALNDLSALRQVKVSGRPVGQEVSVTGLVPGEPGRAALTTTRKLLGPWDEVVADFTTRAAAAAGRKAATDSARTVSVVRVVPSI